MKTSFLLSAAAVAALLLAGCASGGAGSAKAPKYTTHDVMEALHSGKENVGKKVMGGQGAKEDFAMLVDYYSSLPLNDPPKGDKASWQEKTGRLLASAKALHAGAPNALEDYKAAANCKACHSVHKPD